MRTGIKIMCAMMLAGTAATGGHAADVARRSFGTTAAGEPVEAITLTNRHGVSATLISYGARLQALIAPDRAGRPADIVLGYGDIAAYEAAANYIGATVGRFANRIADARFTLDGRTYQLARNDHDRVALHGGVAGFDKRVWTVAKVASGAVASVTFTRTSPDGEEGYPGTLATGATYALDEDSRLTVTLTATSDRATIVNMTNHALFNLAGEGAPAGAMGNVLMLAADGYTPVDARLIPTGAIAPVAGTPFDFRTPRAVGDRIRDARDTQIAIGRGYDHNMVLTDQVGGVLRLGARLSDPVSGRTLEVLTDQPGIQFYAGNFLDGTTVGKSGHAYRQGDGIALEPQHFPDAPNQPGFVAVRLDPGRTYRNVMIFRLTTTGAGQ